MKKPAKSPRKKPAPAGRLPPELDAYCVQVARAYKVKPDAVRRKMLKAAGEVSAVMRVFGQLLDTAISGKELPDETMRLLRGAGFNGLEGHRAVSSRPRPVL